MTDPVLDPTALDRLRRIGGPRLVAAMMRSFIENGASRVLAAREAAAAGNAAGVSDAGHALKSSAGNVGATTLQQVAQRVERDATTVTGPALLRLAAELEAAFGSARIAAEEAIRSVD